MDTRFLRRQSSGVGARRARPERLRRRFQSALRSFLGMASGPRKPRCPCLKLQSTLKTGDQFRNSCSEPAHIGAIKISRPKLANADGKPLATVPMLCFLKKTSTWQVKSDEIWPISTEIDLIAAGLSSLNKLSRTAGFLLDFFECGLEASTAWKV